MYESTPLENGKNTCALCVAPLSLTVCGAVTASDCKVRLRVEGCQDACDGGSSGEKTSYFPTPLVHLPPSFYMYIPMARLAGLWLRAETVLQVHEVWEERRRRAPPCSIRMERKGAGPPLRRA